jgi:hypothetical protein
MTIILNIILGLEFFKHDVSEDGSVSIIRCNRGQAPTEFNP